MAGGGRDGPSARRRRRDLSKPALLQPLARPLSCGRWTARAARPSIRRRRVAIDYLLPEGFSGPVVARDHRCEGARRSHGEPAPAAGRGAAGAGVAVARRRRRVVIRTIPTCAVGQRGRGGAAGLTVKPGHNRFMWDYRWANGGPLAAPGKYTAKLTAGETSQTRTFEVLADPGVLKDGTTVADLVAQQDFLLALRETIAEATATRTAIEQAMTKAGVQPPPAPGAGESTQEQIEKLAKSAEPGREAAGALGAHGHGARHLRAADAARPVQQPSAASRAAPIRRSAPSRVVATTTW